MTQPADGEEVSSSLPALSPKKNHLVNAAGDSDAEIAEVVTEKQSEHTSPPPTPPPAEPCTAPCADHTSQEATTPTAGSTLQDLSSPTSFFNNSTVRKNRRPTLPSADSPRLESHQSMYSMNRQRSVTSVVTGGVRQRSSSGNRRLPLEGVRDRKSRGSMDSVVSTGTEADVASPLVRGKSTRKRPSLPIDRLINILRVAPSRQHQEALEKAKAVSDQKMEWAAEDKQMQQWVTMQKRKLARLDRLLETSMTIDTGAGSRQLSEGEIVSLRAMRDEVCQELEDREADFREKRAKETRLFLSAEHDDMLRKLLAKVEREEKKAQEEEQQKQGKRTTINSAMHNAQEQNKRDQELRKSALEKSRILEEVYARWAEEEKTFLKRYQEQEKKAADLSKKIDQLKQQLHLEERGITKEEQAKVTWEEIEVLEAAQQHISTWLFEQREEFAMMRRAEEDMLPQLTDDERRVLRGMASAKAIKDKRSKDLGMSKRGAQLFGYVQKTPKRMASSTSLHNLARQHSSTSGLPQTPVLSPLKLGTLSELGLNPMRRRQSFDEEVVTDGESETEK